MISNENNKTNNDNFIKYLEFLQNIITRMADNSKMCKQFALSIVTAWIVFARLVLNNGQFIHCFIHLAIIVPILVFYFLDAWYLLFERRYRNKYNSYTDILSKTLSANDIDEQVIKGLYNLNSRSLECEKENTNCFSVLCSGSVLGVYSSLVGVIIVMIFI